jgi:pimeloyl-ACP methyl ester carboxylesterase
VELNHHRVGSGEPLVLLHGIGMQWQAFDPLLEPLSREREVIAVDMPGFGGSPTLPIGVEPTAAAIAEGVAAFLDSKGIERPLVCGLSLGGWVALELAKLGRPRALVLISPGGFASPREAVAARGQLKLSRLGGTRGLPAVKRIMRTRLGSTVALSGMMGHPDRVPYDAAIAMSEAVGMSTGWDGTLRVTSRTGFSGGDEVDVPVTLLWGTKDRLLPPKRMAPRLLEQVPHARHVPIDGAGHLPMWDAPDVLVREILAA